MEIEKSTNTTVELSNEAKNEYLKSLMSKMYKILHLIEEESETGFSPIPFIEGRLTELNSANDMFHGRLVNIIIKLNAIKNNYGTMSFQDCKSQIFEIRKIITAIQKELR